MDASEEEAEANLIMKKPPHNEKHPRFPLNKSRKMVDITRDKPIKVAVRVVVPTRDHPKFNFVGKLLGPKGNSLKRLQEDTMCKMAVLGRGSMRDKHKEEELRSSGDPKFQHLSEELHVEISAYANPAEAHARIAYALAEVRRFLVPDYNDEIRQEQMWEMQVLNKKTQGDNVPINLEESNEINDSSNIHIIELNKSDLNRSNNSSISESSGENISTSSNNKDTSIINNTTSSFNNNFDNPNTLNNLSAGNLNSPNAEKTKDDLGIFNSFTRRKRPLFSNLGSSMTPTKRTVMGLLAKARAAQVKQIPPVNIQKETCNAKTSTN